MFTLPTYSNTEPVLSQKGRIMLACLDMEAKLFSESITKLSLGEVLPK